MSDLARNYVKQLPRSRVSPAQKKFLFFVADYHNVRTGCAWPGLDTIAEDIGITTRQVRNLLRECRELHLIDWIPGLGSGNLGRLVFRDLTPSKAEGKEEIKEEEKEEIGYRAIRKEPGTNTNTKPPYPLFAKGGAKPALSERQINRLRRRIQAILREENRLAGARVGSNTPGLTWREVLLQACQDELIRFDEALPVISAIWDGNVEACRGKKPAKRASA